MKFYSVHYRYEDTADMRTLAENIVLVRDGFAWGGFSAGPVWLAWKAMWIVLAIYLALAVVVISTMAIGVLPGGAGLALLFGLNLVLGFEGHDLERWTLSLKRKRGHGFVAAPDRASAEQRYFAARLSRLQAAVE